MLKTCLYKTFSYVILVFLLGAARPAASFPLPEEGKLTRKQYVEKYKDIAIRQMHAYGIPASIILAQGCLESGDGNSRLARLANNHFGIKCHDWEGEKIYHDDDELQECFRKYATAEDSFLDHSEFLRTRPRYAGLFLLKTTDYKGWAEGLKQAGYATNPRYDVLLIDVIEKNKLYIYDKQVPELTAATYTQGVFILDVERRIMKTNGIPYVLSAPGDTYGSLAKEFNLFTGEITRFNDVPRKAVLAAGEKVYVERKAKKVHKPAPEHVVAQGESLREIAQQYGIRRKALYALNPGMEEYPKPGTVVILR
ncbi:MAG: glucosaminidase domain-containing protein [Bacteroidales bacterium]|jgi:LysM repeat protein